MAAAAAPSLGEQLLAMGWRQGSYLPVPLTTTTNTLQLGPPPKWMPVTVPHSGGIVLATQTCDVRKQQERNVEFVRAFWTSNEKILGPAGKNSFQHFLLRTRVAGAVLEGLVAEASGRMLVQKESLLLVHPEPGCDGPENERRLQKWLGGRYNRPAIPDAVVIAVQKPVVEALRSEPAGSKIEAMLKGVAEVRYAWSSESGKLPFQVELFFVPENGEGKIPITEADAEEVAAWFSAKIAARGEARVTAWDLWPLERTSVVHYTSTTELPLDEFSL